MRCLGCKACGVSALTFCLGKIAGSIFPVELIAVLEAILIVVMGYCCIFKW